MARSVTLRGKGFWLKTLSFNMSFLIPFTEIARAELFNTIKIHPPAPQMPQKAAVGASHKRWGR